MLFEMDLQRCPNSCDQAIPPDSASKQGVQGGRKMGLQLAAALPRNPFLFRNTTVLRADSVLPQWVSLSPKVGVSTKGGVLQHNPRASQLVSPPLGHVSPLCTPHCKFTRSQLTCPALQPTPIHCCCGCCKGLLQKLPRGLGRPHPLSFWAPSSSLNSSPETQ